METAVAIAPTSFTPMDLIARASAGDTSIEKMQQLFDLQLKWESNEAKKAYNQAMSNFRSECPEISKTRKGHNGKYAGLAETIQTINPVLARNGLSHQWKTEQVDGGVKVTCIVTHVLGHSEQTALAANGDKSGGKTDIHALASTISYLERYTLFAMLGLAGQEMDDDGQGKGKVETITEEQTFMLETLIDDVKGAVSKEKGIASFCSYYNIEAIADLPAIKYDAAVKALEKKRSA